MSESIAEQREFALEVVRRLRERGFEALWAGGCVRDQLIGRTPKDFDVATSALPDQVRELFGRRRTLAIGASFGVISVLGGRGLEPIEVAAYRTDGDYRDGRRPDSVAFTDARHDAERRDFTINGLFFDPVAQQVIDYVGGVDDIQAKVIRAIGDPRRRFTEDKLRLLRAVRFAAVLDFHIDPETLAAIREMAAEATSVSGERIGAEMRRILVDAHRRRGVELLQQSRLLDVLLSELAAHADAQSPPWTAALARIERLCEPSPALAIAALTVDMLDRGGVQSLAKRWKLTNKELDRIQWLHAGLPALRGAAALPWPRLQRILAHDGAADALALAAADLLADDAGLVRCQQVFAQEAADWNPPPLVSGDDLLAAGLKPGRRFAELLEYLRDEQLDGRLATPTEALAAAKSWLAAP